MGRYSGLPLEVLEALWRHGIENTTVRVPVRAGAFSLARRREVVAELLGRAEARAEEKNDGSPATVRGAWGSVRTEAARHEISVALMQQCMESAVKDFGRWWAGERRRLAVVRRRDKHKAALLDYRRARRNLGSGQDAPGVRLDILELAAASVSLAWWKRPAATALVPRELVPDAIRLALLRLESCDIRRETLVVAARHGLTDEQVDLLEKDVEAGVLMAEAALHSKEAARDATPVRQQM